MPELFNSTAVRKLKKAQLEFLTADDLNWASELLPVRVRKRLDLRQELSERILNSYSHIRAYHGCRALDTSSYRNSGILPLDPEDASVKVGRIFNRTDFPEISSEELSAAIASVDAPNRERRVFFEANSAHLVEHCGHYLLYGSEYLIAVARAISNIRDYAQVLKNTGTPTLLACDVPLSWVPDGTQNELVGTLTVAYFSRHIFDGYCHPQFAQGFGFEIFRALPPNFIAEITHPKHVPDRI